jgi:hypothetical protein
MYVGKRFKSLYWIGPAIGFAWMGIVLYALCLEVRENSVILGFGLAICMGLATFCMFTAVGTIIRDKKVFTAFGSAQLVFVICGVVLVVPCYTRLTENYRMRKAISDNMLLSLNNISDSFEKYMKATNHMPHADEWCNQLLYKTTGIDRDVFLVNPPNHECDFAFNKSLSDLSRDKLQSNTVLVVEAEGEMNLHGGPELILKPRSKDKYFLLKRGIFVHILFVDGTIVRYRLRDGAVAEYVRDESKFREYMQRGKTPYSPLTWEP